MAFSLAGAEIHAASILIPSFLAATNIDITLIFYQGVTHSLCPASIIHNLWKRLTEVPWGIFIVFYGDGGATSLETNGKNLAMRPGNCQMFHVGVPGYEWETCSVNTVIEKLYFSFVQIAEPAELRGRRRR